MTLTHCSLLQPGAQDRGSSESNRPELILSVAIVWTYGRDTEKKSERAWGRVCFAFACFSHLIARPGMDGETNMCPHFPDVGEFPGSIATDKDQLGAMDHYGSLNAKKQATWG